MGQKKFPPNDQHQTQTAGTRQEVKSPPLPCCTTSVLRLRRTTPLDFLRVMIHMKCPFFRGEAGSPNLSLIPVLIIIRGEGPLLCSRHRWLPHSTLDFTWCTHRQRETGRGNGHSAPLRRGVRPRPTTRHASLPQKCKPTCAHHL